MMNTQVLKLSSQPQSIKMVEEFLATIAIKYKIKEDVYPNILISLTEAVNNAIYHGNACDEKKCVHVIQLQNENGMLTFKISDEGDGFNHEDIPDPTIDENCAREGGRGVFLMKSLSDRVTYLDYGRTVEIQFNIC